MRHWGTGEECVVYNDLSGDTHLLGGQALHVLLALQSSPAAESAIAASLSAEFEFDTGSDIAADVAELLSELQELALIEC